MAHAMEGLADEVEALLALILRIVDDELVICSDLDGAHTGFESVIDLSEPDAVLDVLTRRWFRALEIKTWGGRGDRRVSRGEPA